MAQAAYALYQRCVVQRGIGGIAADIGASLIFLLQVRMLCRVFFSEGLARCLLRTLVNPFFSTGGDNHLNIVIADYAPNVRCDRTPTPGPPWESCLAIVADMVATRDRKVFGDKNRDPRVEVNLPFFYKAGTFDPSSFMPSELVR